MKAIDLIEKKLYSLYPESWQIFEYSCQYTIDNGLDFIKGVLLNRENKVEYYQLESLYSQLRDYLSHLGYKNSIISKDTFATKKGHEHGVVFIIFLSAPAIEAYLKESKEYQESVAGNSRFNKAKERPIHDKIRYLNIYTKLKSNATR